jgi:hypothetical protein
MTLTKDQIAAGMATQYGRIDQNALRTLAHKIAAQHPEIRAAGIALAELLGIEGETAEPFIQAFGDNLVETVMYLGKVPSMGYRIDLLGAPMASPILVAACKDVGLNPELLPSDFSMELSNFRVTLRRGGTTTTVWELSVAQLVACYREWLGRFKFVGRAQRPRLDELLAHEPAGHPDMAGHGQPGAGGHSGTFGHPETGESLLGHNWFGNSATGLWDGIGPLSGAGDETILVHETGHCQPQVHERRLAPADQPAQFRCADQPIAFPVEPDARRAPEPPAGLDPFANE